MWCGESLVSEIIENRRYQPVKYSVLISTCFIYTAGVESGTISVRLNVIDVFFNYYY